MGQYLASKETDMEEKDTKLISFKKIIEALEKEGLRTCDIHLEETEVPNYQDYKQFTGSVVIKTFPEKLLITG
jgi:hypothetical protein